MANKLGTYCEECCFFNKDTNDCDHGLISIFKDRGAEIDWHNSYPRIDRVCLYKRNKDWKIEKSIEDKLLLSSNQIYIMGTIIIIAHDAESLKTTIDQLKQEEHLINFKLLILYDKIKYKDILDICGNNINTSYKCIYMATNNIPFQIYKALEFAKNGFLFILESEKAMDSNLIDRINTMVNKKLFRLLHVSNDGQLHQSVNMIHLYKYLKGDLQCPIKEKIKDIASQESSDPQVFSWKEVNEYCIN
jgi:hypothetical protein